MKLGLWGLEEFVHLPLAACQSVFCQNPFALLTETSHDLVSRGMKSSKCWDEAHYNFFGEYQLRENDYSFDALQTYCFRINIKL